MIAAVIRPIGFQPMTDNPAVAHVARWREPMYRTFETVEREVLPVLGDDKALIVLISTSVAFAHDIVTFKILVLILRRDSKAIFLHMLAN